MTLGFLFTIMTPLLDEAGDGSSGGGTGGSGSTGAGASGQQQTGGQQQTSQTSTATNQGQGSQAQGSQGATGQAGSTTAKQYTYPEDRTDWIPRHRLSEESTKRKTLETQYAEAQRQIAALTGNRTPDANETKAQQIKENFFNLPGMGIFRKLSELSEEQLDRLLQTPDHVEAARNHEQQQWKRYGDQQVDTIAGQVAEAIGVEALDEDQKTDLRVSFTNFIKSQVSRELQQAVDRYGDEAVASDQRRFSETLRKYEDGDAKLLDAFVARYTKNWVEPARRTSTANQANRTRPVPNSGGRTPVTSIQRPAKFNSLDERIEYAANLAKERGVQFGR